MGLFAKKFTIQTVYRYIFPIENVFYNYLIFYLNLLICMFYGEDQRDN